MDVGTLRRLYAEQVPLRMADVSLDGLEDSLSYPPLCGIAMGALMPRHLWLYRRQPQRNSYHRQRVPGTKGPGHTSTLNQHQIAAFQKLRHGASRPDQNGFAADSLLQNQGAARADMAWSGGSASHDAARNDGDRGHSNRASACA